MPASPIRNVIFDFGGVLVRWQPQVIVSTFFKDEVLQRAVMTDVIQHTDWQDMDRGTLDESTAARRFADRVGRSVDEMTAFLLHVKGSLDPIPETIEILLNLSRRGIPLYGLSNMPMSTFEYLRARDAHFGVFRGVVISGDVKMIKPEPQIFEHITQLHSLTPAECLFIDDSKPNIDTAKRLGFHTVWYQTPAIGGAEINRLLQM